MIGTGRREEDLQATIREKITKSRDLESPGRESEARDDDKCQAWVIGCRWRFWGDVFHPHGACDWKATLASTFEREAELWALIAAEIPSEPGKCGYGKRSDEGYKNTRIVQMSEGRGRARLCM